MSETTAAPAAEAAAHAHAEVSYKTYWMAWLALLALTIVMVFVKSPTMLIIGMLIKASVIAFLFMHLMFEKRDFVILVIASGFVLSLILFGLMIPDGMVM